MKILTQYTSKYFSWIIRALEIQLCISIISLPILIYWGQAFSFIGLMSNIFFGPFLMLFLFLASLLFFTQVFYLPNQWIVIALNTLSNFIFSVLCKGSSSWLISFAIPPFFIIFFILLSAFALIHKNKFNQISKTLYWILLFIMIVISLKQLYKPKNDVVPLKCNNGVVTVMYENNNVIVIDPGYLAQRPSGETWLEYILMPTLNKLYGKSTIDHFIVMQPSIRIFDCISRLSELTEIKNLYFPYWSGTADKRFLTAFGRMRKNLSDKTTIKRIGKYKQSISASIYLESIDQKIPYKDIFFNALNMVSNISNQDLKIYSAKYKNVDTHT
ncbi:MAG: hypothetical protein WDZ41_00795 [Candidatus Babeliales bacterium]